GDLVRRVFQGRRAADDPHAGAGGRLAVVGALLSDTRGIVRTAAAGAALADRAIADQGRRRPPRPSAAPLRPHGPDPAPSSAPPPRRGRAPRRAGPAPWPASSGSQPPGAPRLRPPAPPGSPRSRPSPRPSRRRRG